MLLFYHSRASIRQDVDDLEKAVLKNAAEEHHKLEHMMLLTFSHTITRRSPSPTTGKEGGLGGRGRRVSYHF